jgi:hypothetical protein
METNKLGIILDSFIKNKVNEILEKKEIPDSFYVQTDSLAEIIEKLIILHIRMWMLEDAVQTSNDDFEILELEKKIDICFKIKRPKFVQAINLLFDNAIIENKSLREDSVKLYKGIDN